jgi:hypothetical protein
MVKVGGEECKIKSITSTEIICENTIVEVAHEGDPPKDCYFKSDNGASYVGNANVDTFGRACKTGTFCRNPTGWTKRGISFLSIIFLVNLMIKNEIKLFL